MIKTGVSFYVFGDYTSQQKNCISLVVSQAQGRSKNDVGLFLFPIKKHFEHTKDTNPGLQQYIKKQKSENSVNTLLKDLPKQPHQIHFLIVGAVSRVKSFDCLESYFFSLDQTHRFEFFSS